MTRTVSITEVREDAEGVIERAAGEAVAVTRGDKVEFYSVPGATFEAMVDGVRAASPGRAGRPD